MNYGLEYALSEFTNFVGGSISDQQTIKIYKIPEAIIWVQSNGTDTYYKVYDLKITTEQTTHTIINLNYKVMSSTDIPELEIINTNASFQLLNGSCNIETNQLFDNDLWS
jgi:uncharacterized ubiquitin-like protein YukD